MKRFLLVYAIAILCLPVGCSEEGVTPPPNTSPPLIRILHPVDLSPGVWRVSDEVQVYVAVNAEQTDGRDEEIARVSLWFRHPRFQESRRIALEMHPIDPDMVTDEEVRPYIEQLPEGWELYVRTWFTGPSTIEEEGRTPINSGIEVQLYATAQTVSEHESISEPVRIAIFNMGDNLRPPTPEFTITPSEGTVNETFEFDPSGTFDHLSPNEEIRARWDFTGNGVWDIDWNANANASQVQTHRYENPGTFHPTLEVRNSYLADSVRARVRLHAVTPEGGEPRPPHLNYARVDPLTYTRGAATVVVDSLEHPTDASELPVHQVRLRAAFFIEKTEVTNTLYLRYLQAALSDTTPTTVELLADRIVCAETRVTHLEFRNSRIRFDLDQNRLRIAAGYDEHPVTGVSWYGARAYSIFYGLRLPSEAEWEAAARGTEEDLRYPYLGGEEFLSEEGQKRINYGYSGYPPGRNDTTPVGFYDGRTVDGFQTSDSPSIYGLYDMAGNAAEWTNDWHGRYPSGTVTDPQGPLFGLEKVVRGGHYLSSSLGVRLTIRAGAIPDQTYSTVGFRTAYVEFN